MTITPSIEILTKKVSFRYYVFSAAYVTSALAVAASLGVINPYLGIACFFAELTYFNYVNMVNLGEQRHRLRAANTYTKNLEALPAETVTTGGQYL